MTQRGKLPTFKTFWTLTTTMAAVNETESVVATPLDAAKQDAEKTPSFYEQMIISSIEAKFDAV